MIALQQILIILVNLSIIITLFSNYFLNKQMNSNKLNSTIGIVSNEYQTLITPAKWTFLIWMIIYLWQIIWIILANYIIFFVKQFKFFNSFLVVYVFSQLLTILWTYLFIKKLTIYSSVLLFIIVCSLFFVTLCSIYMINYFWLNINNVTSHLKLLKISKLIIINGLTIYLVWCIIASILNLNISIIYDYKVSNEKSSIICLVIIFLIQILYFVFDTIFVVQNMQSIFIVYPVFIWAISGIVSSNIQSKNQNSSLTIKILSAIILVVNIAMFLCKIIKSIPFDIVNKFCSCCYSKKINIPLKIKASDYKNLNSEDK